MLSGPSKLWNKTQKRMVMSCINCDRLDSRCRDESHPSPTYDYFCRLRSGRIMKICTNKDDCMIQTPQWCPHRAGFFISGLSRIFRRYK